MVLYLCRVYVGHLDRNQDRGIPQYTHSYKDSLFLFYYRIIFRLAWCPVILSNCDSTML